MSESEAQEYFAMLDKALAEAEQEMLRDKASRGESLVYADRDGNIYRALASDVQAGRVGPAKAKAAPPPPRGRRSQMAGKTLSSAERISGDAEIVPSAGDGSFSAVSL